jgi:hypothetical protein
MNIPFYLRIALTYYLVGAVYVSFLHSNKTKRRLPRREKLYEQVLDFAFAPWFWPVIMYMRNR